MGDADLSRAKDVPREESVGYTLSQLGFETSRRFGDLVAGLGLEPRHFGLLNALARGEGESQQSCARRLHIPASTMVAVIDSLEREGLVERRLHATDRRTRTLHLTANGSAVLHKARTLAWSLEEEICGGFGASERKELLRLLRRVASNLGVARGSLPDKGSGDRPCLPGGHDTA